MDAKLIADGFRRQEPFMKVAFKPHARTLWSTRQHCLISTSIVMTVDEALTCDALDDVTGLREQRLVCGLPGSGKTDDVEVCLGLPMLRHG